MPELPEVEAARSAIAEHCIGKKIIKAIIANDSKVIDGISPSDFEASLLNKTIVAAHRKGKNMWLQLDCPPFPSFQFGMAGAVYIKGVAVTKYKRSAVNDTDEWPSKHSKFFVELNDGLEVSFTDTRRFAKVRLLDDPASVPPISELGPDTLLEPMTQEEFYKSLSQKKIAIKTLLLDQSFISGIGNWIADEVLYQARIHPLQHASSFSKDDSARLQKSIKEVIWHAVEVDADCQHFPYDWLFHFRWGKKPGKVDGKKINFITVGGRTTAIVPELQKQTGEQATKAPAKPRKQASKKKSSDDDHDGNGEDNDDNDGDAADSDNDEEERGNLKSKRTKISKGGVKKPRRRNMTTKSDDDDDETTKSRGSRALAKRKSRGEGKKAPMENNDSDVGDEDGDERRAIKAKGHKPQVKMQTRKKAK